MSDHLWCGHLQQSQSAKAGGAASTFSCPSFPLLVRVIPFWYILTFTPFKRYIILVAPWSHSRSTGCDLFWKVSSFLRQVYAAAVQRASELPAQPAGSEADPAGDSTSQAAWTRAQYVHPGDGIFQVPYRLCYLGNNPPLLPQGKFVVCARQLPVT